MLSAQGTAIDRDFTELAENWRRFNYDMTNAYGYGIFLSSAEKIRDALAGLQSASPFEQLWADNIQSEVGVMEALAHHYHGKPKMSVPDLLDTACGPDTYALVENGFTDVDREDHWNLGIDNMRRGKKTRRYTGEAEEKVATAARQLRDEIVQIGAEGEFLPKGFDLRIDIDKGRPYWNLELRRLFLAYDSFVLDDNDGILAVNLSYPFQIAFHEVLGHASQQHHSQRLPQSLQLTSNNVINIPSRVVYEGLALQREAMAFDWLRAHAERLGIDPAGIDLMERNFALSYTQVSSGVTASILRERAYFDGTDLKTYLRGLTDNQRVIYHLSDPVGSGFLTDPLTIDRVLYELCYPAGYRFFRDIQSHASADPKALRIAQSTGQWAWQTYPRAVAYFLNEPCDRTSTTMAERDDETSAPL